MAIGDTTMKIFKWVPGMCMVQLNFISSFYLLSDIVTHAITVTGVGHVLLCMYVCVCVCKYESILKEKPINVLSPNLAGE